MGLLNEGHKIEVYRNRTLLSISSFPYWDQEQRDLFVSGLALPDDMLGDILEIEESSAAEKEQFKQDLNGQ